MEMLLFLLAAIHITGLLIVLLAITKAPYGYEDAQGFHKCDNDHPLLWGAPEQAVPQTSRSR